MMAMKNNFFQDTQNSQEFDQNQSSMASCYEYNLQKKSEASFLQNSPNLEKQAEVVAENTRGKSNSGNFIRRLDTEAYNSEIEELEIQSVKPNPTQEIMEIMKLNQTFDQADGTNSKAEDNFSNFSNHNAQKQTYFHEKAQKGSLQKQKSLEHSKKMSKHTNNNPKNKNENIFSKKQETQFTSSVSQMTPTLPSKRHRRANSQISGRNQFAEYLNSQKNEKNDTVQDHRFSKLSKNSKNNTIKNTKALAQPGSISESQRTKEKDRERYNQMMEQQLKNIRKMDLFGRGNLSKSPMKHRKINSVSISETERHKISKNANNFTNRGFKTDRSAHEAIENSKKVIREIRQGSHSPLKSYKNSKRRENINNSINKSGYKVFNFINANGDELADGKSVVSMMTKMDTQSAISGADSLKYGARSEILLNRDVKRTFTYQNQLGLGQEKHGLRSFNFKQEEQKGGKQQRYRERNVSPTFNYSKGGLRTNQGV